MRRRHILVPLALTILASTAVAAPAGAATGSLSSLGSLSSPTTPTGTGATFENPYSTDTSNKIVAFGDSFTSNSASYVNAAPQNYPTYPRTEGCLTAPDAWPAQLGAITPAPGPELGLQCAHDRPDAGPDRPRHRLRSHQRHLTGDPGCQHERQAAGSTGCRGRRQPGLCGGEGAGRRSRGTDRHLGRLATTNAEGRFCDRNTVPDQPTGAIDRKTAAFEAATQNNQRAAAAQADVQFIDIRSMTIEANSSFGLDADRFISGVTDTTTPDYNMPAHPSLAGSRLLAQQVSAVIVAAAVTGLLP